MASVHNTTRNSFDNLPSDLQTNIIAQMLSIGGEGKYKSQNYTVINLWNGFNHDQLLLSSNTMGLYESLIVSEMPSSQMLQKSPILQVGMSKPQAWHNTMFKDFLKSNTLNHYQQIKIQTEKHVFLTSNCVQLTKKIQWLHTISDPNVNVFKTAISLNEVNASRKWKTPVVSGIITLV